MNNIPINIRLIALCAEYSQPATHPWLAATHAVFCTERTDFGGFSYSYTLRLFETSEIKTKPRLIEWEEAMNGLPGVPRADEAYVIKTPITHNRQEAYELMLTIGSICTINQFQLIRLTQFIHLTSNQHATFEGMAQALLTILQNDLRPKVIIDITPTHYTLFCDVMENHGIIVERSETDNPVFANY